MTGSNTKTDFEGALEVLFLLTAEKTWKIIAPTKSYVNSKNVKIITKLRVCVVSYMRKIYFTCHLFRRWDISVPESQKCCHKSLFFRRKKNKKSTSFHIETEWTNYIIDVLFYISIKSYWTSYSWQYLLFTNIDVEFTLIKIIKTPFSVEMSGLTSPPCLI